MDTLHSYIAASPQANEQPVPFINPAIRTTLPGGNIMTTDGVSMLLEQRIIIFAYPFTDFIATQIIIQLLYLDSQSTEPITIYLNSGGGSVTAGFALYDVMVNLRSPVTIIGMGLCASMGAFLLCTGSPGNRYAMANTTVMIHQPSYSAEGKVTHGKAHWKWAEELKERLIGTMAKHCNVDYDWLVKQMEEDLFLNAVEAREYGLIDEIVQPPAGKFFVPAHELVLRSDNKSPGANNSEI